MQKVFVTIAGIKPFLADDVQLKVETPLIEHPAGFGFKSVKVEGLSTVTVFVDSAISGDVAKGIKAWHNQTLNVAGNYKRRVEIDVGNGKKLVLNNAFIEEITHGEFKFGTQTLHLGMRIAADSYAEDNVNPAKLHPEIFLGYFKKLEEVFVCLNKNKLALRKGMTIGLRSDISDTTFYTYEDFGWERRSTGFTAGNLPKANIKSLEQFDDEAKAAAKAIKAEKAADAAEEKEQKPEQKPKIVHPPDPKHSPLVAMDFAEEKSKTVYGVAALKEFQQKSLESMMLTSKQMGEKEPPKEPVPELPPEEPAKDEIFPRKRIIRRKKA